MALKCTDNNSEPYCILGKAKNLDDEINTILIKNNETFFHKFFCLRKNTNTEYDC